MLRYSYLFVLAGVFQIISSQGPQRGPPGGPQGQPGFPSPGYENIPEKCREPPQGVENPEECCNVHQMYTEEELSNCGLKKDDNRDDQERQGPPDCTKPLCMLKQKNLLDENNKINYNNAALFLDKWAGDGSLKPASEVAKTICLQDKNVPGPPEVCEPARLIHCVGSVIFDNCPAENWLKTDSCKILKEHIEECKPYFQ